MLFMFNVRVNLSVVPRLQVVSNAELIDLQDVVFPGRIAIGAQYLLHCFSFVLRHRCPCGFRGDDHDHGVAGFVPAGVSTPTGSMIGDSCPPGQDRIGNSWSPGEPFRAKMLWRIADPNMALQFQHDVLSVAAYAMRATK